jgi:hypothetical protein
VRDHFEAHHQTWIEGRNPKLLVNFWYTGGEKRAIILKRMLQDQYGTPCNGKIADGSPCTKVAVFGTRDAPHEFDHVRRRSAEESSLSDESRFAKKCEDFIQKGDEGKVLEPWLAERGRCQMLCHACHRRKTHGVGEGDDLAGRLVANTFAKYRPLKMERAAKFFKGDEIA